MGIRKLPKGLDESELRGPGPTSGSHRELDDELPSPESVARGLPTSSLQPQVAEGAAGSWAGEAVWWGLFPSDRLELRERAAW